MKTLTKVLLGLLLGCILAGCGKHPVTEPVNTEAESYAAESTESVAAQETAPIKKEMIRLQNLNEQLQQHGDILGIVQTDPDVKTADIDYPALPAMEERFAAQPELKVFSEYAKKEFGIELDGNWNVNVYFNNPEGTYGSLELQYYVGEIATDRSLMFSLNDGKVPMVFFRNLDKTVNEAALLSRVKNFEARYEQETYQPKDGEKLREERRSFTYYCGSDMLVYSYAVFFEYNGGMINNDYGSTCRIGENGEADFGKLNNGPKTAALSGAAAFIFEPAEKQPAAGPLHGPAENCLSQVPCRSRRNFSAITSCNPACRRVS